MEILLDNYANIVHIEALTALDMARQEIVPAIIGYEGFIAKTLGDKTIAGIKGGVLERKTLNKISALSDKFSEKLEELENGLNGFPDGYDALTRAKYCKDVLICNMDKLREFADAAELILGKNFRPFPSYADILYSVKY